MLLLDAFGVFLAVTLACAVWGPDVLRWIATQLGIHAPPNNARRRFGFD